MNIDAPPLFKPPSPPLPRQELSAPGFLRAIRTNPLSMWTDAAYDQDIVVRRFLGRTQVLLNAPDTIHRVLVDNPGNYRRSPASVRILRPITGNGLLLSEGEAWRLQRRTTAPALAPRVMPMLARHIVAVAQEQLAAIAEQAAQGPIDLLTVTQNLTLDIAGRSMFSLEMRAFGAALRGLLAEFPDRFARPNLFDMVLPLWVPTLRDLRRRRFQARWMRLVEAIMHDRLREPAQAAPRDLFDLLRAARDPESGAAFSSPQLRDQVATLLLAGHETTAVALFWSLTLLAQDTAAQEQVAEEARGIAFAEDAGLTVLPRLVRTRAVVNEALRLYPPAAIMAREAIGPDRLGAFDLPARALVMIAPWVLHRHRTLWRAPEAFDPGRFMPDAPTPPRFAYLPFGAGPRVCVGAQFALTEAVLVLAMLVQRFAFSLADARPVLPVTIVTTQPDHRAAFRLRER